MLIRQAAAPTAKVIRVIHFSMISGVVLFALVAHFVMRPSMAADAGDLPATLVGGLLGVALIACAVSLLLRRRVPQRTTDESADLFWATASAPAQITWAALEGAGLLSAFLYGRTGSPSAIGVAAIAVVLLLILNPARLARS
jgi:hypothetical protein